MSSPSTTLKRRNIIGPSPSASPAPSSTAGTDGADGAHPSPPSNQKESRAAAYVGILGVAFFTFAYCFYTASLEQKIDAETLWLPSELAKYNGTDGTKGLLLSITGLVFDVTKGGKHYGKGKSYNHFCGRDATRAFVSGVFKGEGLTDDVEDLSDDELKSLEGWREFYFTTYPHVGKVIGRFYDSSGKQTKHLVKLLNKIKNAKINLKKNEEEDSKIRGCNSKWTQETGGEVWCDEGYPRKVLRAGSPKSGPDMRIRCGCIDERDLGGPDQQEYPDCGPRDSLCKT